MELALAMAGVISVWSGVLKVAERGGMIDRLAARLTPLMDFLFPSVPRRILQENISLRFCGEFSGAWMGGNTCRTDGDEGAAEAEPRGKGTGIGGNVYVSDGEHDLPAAGYDEYSGVPHE